MLHCDFKEIKWNRIHAKQMVNSAALLEKNAANSQQQ